jgi:hypothetical protein
MIAVLIALIGAASPVAVAYIALKGDDGVHRTTETGGVVGKTCHIAIVSPKNRTRVQYRRGTVVRGTACETDSIWLFDYDEEDRYYYRDNESPIDVIAESWSYRDAPIGDPRDAQGTEYRIVAVRTNASCNRRLHGLRADKSDSVRVRHLPKPCPSTASRSQAASIVLVR